MSAITGVRIVPASGRMCGVVGEDVVLRAVVTPDDATTPITYTWSANGLFVGQGTSEATYRFLTRGRHSISVTVENAVGGPFTAQGEVMVASQNIRDELYAILSGVALPDLGQVHDYKRWAVLRRDYLNLYQKDGQIRGWDIEAGPFRVEQVEMRGSTPRVLRTRTFYVNGFLSWNDESESEKTAEELALVVADAIDGDEVLHQWCGYYHTAPVQLVAFEPRLIGNVLVHYIRLQVEVTVWTG